MAASLSDGLRSVCADPKYYFYGYNVLNTEAVMPVSCNIVPLPDTFYSEPLAFVITKNSPYKGLINWRWDNQIKSTRDTTDTSLQLWVPRKLPSTKWHVHQLFRKRVLSWWKYDSFVPILKCRKCCWLEFETCNWKFV